MCWLAWLRASGGGRAGADGADGADGLGLTDASVDEPCTVTLAGPTVLNGTLQWFEQAAGVYVMSCDTNP
jgi:hypothetical protein